METLLSNPILDKDRRASHTSACSKLITQYKCDLVTLNLQIIQDIRRDYQNILARQLKELSTLDWIDPIKRSNH